MIQNQAEQSLDFISERFKILIVDPDPVVIFRIAEIQGLDSVLLGSKLRTS